MTDTRPLSVYIHWPFCAAKCPYCDFNVHLQQTISEDAYVDALIRELDFYAGRIDARPALSVFFGGGTPSLMRPESVARLIHAVRDRLGLVKDVEISLEINPTAAETEKLAAFCAGGVNRLSIGVQSLQDDELKRLGRNHSGAEARAAITAATSACDNVSIDLIYARSGQTTADWAQELAMALELGLPHLSLYQLTVEPGTQFHTLYSTGRLRLPDDALAADLYEMTAELTQAAGMPAYEISNHARAGYESCHNLNYWQGGDYIGLGAGAHGRLHCTDGSFIATVGHRAPSVWLERAQQNGHGAHPFEDMTPDRSLSERLLFGLRLTDGIAFDRTWSLNQTVLQDARAHGLLTTDETRLQATPAGRLVLSSLVQRLLG